MKIFPKETFEVRTSVSVNEILAVLDAQVVPFMSFQWRMKGRRLKGRLSPEGFAVKGVIGFGNLHPLSEGKFLPQESGTLIRVTTQLNIFDKIFLSIWFAIPILACILLFPDLPLNSFISILIYIFLFFVVIFPTVILHTLYSYQVRMNRRIILDVFEKEGLCEP